MGDRLATIDMGRKEGYCAPSRGSWIHIYITVSPGRRPTSVPSGILIHPAVWPQQNLLLTDRKSNAMHVALPRYLVASGGA